MMLKGRQVYRFGTGTMAPQTILIIRHAEKPEDGAAAGVDATGAPDPKSLTPRGWQRAGAWAELFAPSLGQPSALPRPTAFYASAPTSHHEIRDEGVGSKSRRPVETITPLSEKLKLPIDQTFEKGQEAELAEAISSQDGVVLVCWQHEDIAAIANALKPPHGVPANWLDTCFNVIYRFDRPDGTSPWTFRQIVPVMLDGDTADAN